MATKKVSILTDEERIQLPLVLKRRQTAKDILETSIRNHRGLFSNCLLIQGKPGTGKTTLVINHLSRMLKLGEIAGYRRIAGHITPTKLFSELRACSKTDESDAPQVIVMDDVDCLSDDNCLELLKAAFDTKVALETNRVITGKTVALKDSNHKTIGSEDTTFKFDGFGIIITNTDFSKGNLTINQEALLDRVQSVNIDLRKSDMAIYNAHIVEKYLNDNEDNLTNEEIDRVAECYEVDVRRWLRTDAFRNARVNFSLRVIKKFIDCARLFKDDWRMYNSTYIALNNASTAYEEILKNQKFSEENKEPEVVQETLSHRSTKVPVFYNERNGKKYSESHCYKLFRDGYVPDSMGYPVRRDLVG